MLETTNGPIHGTLEYFQNYANALKTTLHIIELESGEHIDIKPVNSRAYPFHRVVAQVQVHIDDRPKIQQYAKELNAQRKLAMI